MLDDHDTNGTPDSQSQRPRTLREWEDQLDWLENQQRDASAAAAPGLFTRFARLVASAMKRLVGGRSAHARAPLTESSGTEVNDPPPPVPAPAPARAPAPGPGASSRRASVLVVEDDRTARATIATILERSAFDVWEAGTVEEAIGRLADRPDWVLLDLMLPDGSGCAVLRDVNDRHIGTKVCVISGAGPTMIGEARSLGVRHVLPKPLNLPRLMDILAT